MNETLGQRIHRFRKAMSLSQEALAEKLGVSSQAVSKWENDTSCPDISLLPEIAKVFQITVDNLLTGQSNAVQMVPESQRKPIEQLTLRVNVVSSEGDKVRINLPMALVRVAMEVGLDILPNYADNMEALRNLDLNRIMELAEKGLIGKIVEVESAEGDTVEVVVE